jgi:CheY-like chemotaxis protein
MNDYEPPILIASDRPLDAEGVARALTEEFPKVHVSTDPKRCAQDFELHKPAVLILAFNSLERAQRYHHALQQPSVMVSAPPYRTVVLCTAEDARTAYELCRKGSFDDFVQYWPKAEDAWALRMAARRGVDEAMRARSDTPRARDFIAAARRLAAFESALDERIERSVEAGQPDEGLHALREPLRGLWSLANRRVPLIMVVDDDKFQHKLLGPLLEPMHAEVACYLNASDAIASLHKRRPDLILMDISLPDLSGVDATRLLKSSAQYAGIPVIMITGVGGKEAVVDSLRAGAAGIVVKPLDKGALLGKVEKVLNG